MLSSAEIRKQFLDFFRSKGHEIVPSAPIVIKNDPTLMFTNAGMNQFKEYFLGHRKPSYSRVADTQKCLRVSGKHNDLEEVGVDTYHHTMFEMLGNWSFGDPAHPESGYFKKEAIAWSWELLTEVYKLDKSRLYVTIFEGDQKEGLPKDDEAYNEWKKVIAEDRILMGNKKDNFWEMGDTGPCGPCTEIHVDCRTDKERAEVEGRTLVNNDHPLVIEIWNNVFIQFNRKKDGTLEQLPAKHVDTGMGFERLVRVLQGKNSNYDTDVFSGTINEVAGITGKEYDNGDDKPAIAIRVVADHIRAISFTIADGQLPTNTGAGYVIRRILRRAVRYYYTYLDVQATFAFPTRGHIGQSIQKCVPGISETGRLCCQSNQRRGRCFLRTLGKGIERFQQYETSNILQPVTLDNQDEPWDKPVINGKFAFELYDTYGFPLDLTKLMASEKGWVVDETSFESEMQQQKDRSRAATKIDTEDWIEVHNSGKTKFVGYDELEVSYKSD
jgi:alanyl-tRNA synthetase